MDYFFIVLGTFLGTLFLATIVLNLLPGEKNHLRELDTEFDTHDEHFRHVVSQLLGPPLVAGNRVEGLVNGVQIFPAMLAAIRGAERTICFESYIYWSGEIGEEFSDALCERAVAGVHVHVMLDWVGSGKIDKKLLDKMRDAGVEIERYRPLSWYHVTRMNNRTHRKLLVVDGRVGFTGGVGIADEWMGNADSPKHWRDSHYRLEGPAVAQMQAAFMDNWIKTRSVVHSEQDYFPMLAPAGPALAQVFKSSSREGSDSARLMYVLSIASARKSILIANAYFVPDEFAVKSLITAAKRGVTIRIVVPGTRTDQLVVRHASRSLWGRLLEAGIEIYEYQPTMYHCKIMVVDGIWTSVGSTNFDNRSFRLNDEANLNVFDEAFASAETKQIEADIAQSRRATLESWEKRPLREKLLEKFARVFRSQI